MSKDDSAVSEISESFEFLGVSNELLTKLLEERAAVFNLQLYDHTEIIPLTFALLSGSGTAFPATDILHESVIEALQLPKIMNVAMYMTTTTAGDGTNELQKLALAIGVMRKDECGSLFLPINDNFYNHATLLVLYYVDRQPHVRGLHIDSSIGRGSVTFSHLYTFFMNFGIRIESARDECPRVVFQQGDRIRTSELSKKNISVKKKDKENAYCQIYRIIYSFACIEYFQSIDCEPSTVSGLTDHLKKHCDKAILFDRESDKGKTELPKHPCDYTIMQTHRHIKQIAEKYKIPYNVVHETRDRKPLRYTHYGNNEMQNQPTTPMIQHKQNVKNNANDSTQAECKMKSCGDYSMWIDVTCAVLKNTVKDAEKCASYPEVSAAIAIRDTIKAQVAFLYITKYILLTLKNATI